MEREWRLVLAPLIILNSGPSLSAALPLSKSRTSLILVDQVIVTLAASVITFSELDILTKTLQSETDMGLLGRLRWKSKETTSGTSFRGLNGASHRFH